MPPPFASHSVWTRTYEPTFKHVSVPGTYQKPAPYRLQTLTYSTGLAFTGRSAAFTPPTTKPPAAAPHHTRVTALIPPSPFPPHPPHPPPPSNTHPPTTNPLLPP